MTNPRLLLLTIMALVIGTGLALLRIIDGAQWVQLVAYVLGLHAAGTAGVQVAKPAGDYLAAQAQKILSRQPEAR